MKNRISDKHNLFKAKYVMNEIIFSSFNASRISFFSYGKFYKDGTVNLLSTCPDFYQYAMQMKYQFTSPIPKSLISKQFYYLLEHERSYEKVITDCANLFSIHHPIDIFIVGDDFYEMFCFGLNQGIRDTANFYLNCLDYLKEFCSLFKIKAFTLIEEGEEQRLYLPPASHSNLLKDCRLIKDKNTPFRGREFINDVVVSKLVLNSLNNKKTLNQPSIRFSRRESECIRYLCKGFSYKQIGRKLNISDRTVEYYIKMAKQKAHCKKQSELVTKFLDSSSAFIEE